MSVLSNSATSLFWMWEFLQRNSALERMWARMAASLHTGHTAQQTEEEAGTSKAEANDEDPDREKDQGHKFHKEASKSKIASQGLQRAREARLQGDRRDHPQSARHSSGHMKIEKHISS
ncbi:hypothetical protein NPIL_297341 [Nephila pilipes]|uniref:Uncharacterized protein n=1 Tax=Nephila pilipes TaxID=299642 RepID=A0A8X6TY42_NEPPI|nr:hypothetical protein NPIL_297341 [Nephila pilipes]